MCMRLSYCKDLGRKESTGEQKTVEKLSLRSRSWEEDALKRKQSESIPIHRMNQEAAVPSTHEKFISWEVMS